MEYETIIIIAVVFIDYGRYECPEGRSFDDDDDDEDEDDDGDDGWIDL